MVGTCTRATESGRAGAQGTNANGEREAGCSVWDMAKAWCRGGGGGETVSSFKKSPPCKVATLQGGDLGGDLCGGPWIGLVVDPCGFLAVLTGMAGHAGLIALHEP